MTFLYPECRIYVMLARKLGSNQLATLIDAGVFLVVSTIGASLLSYCPKLVLGRLLLFLGLSLLIEWVVTAGAFLKSLAHRQRLLNKY